VTGNPGYHGTVATLDRTPRFDPACPMRAFPLQIGDKWTARVVLGLEDRPRRFTELKRMLGSVSAKVLAETLRAMERDGLLTRASFDVNPPRVEYGLTALGRSLLQLIDAARTWARDNLDDLLQARGDHDRERPQPDPSVVARTATKKPPPNSTVPVPPSSSRSCAGVKWRL
jgi:DNA-binding HxlR family transcriptional regulator